MNGSVREGKGEGKRKGEGKKRRLRKGGIKENWMRQNSNTMDTNI